MEPRLARLPRAGGLLFLAMVGACRLEVREPVERGRAGSTLAGVADSTAVISELRQYYAHLSARDWPAFADHFWPDATLSTVWQAPGDSAPALMVTTVPEFVARAPQGPGARAIFDERMVEARVTLAGDLAQAWVRYRARFGDPGDIREWSGIDAFTLLRQAGRWRILTLAFAGDDAGS